MKVCDHFEGTFRQFYGIELLAQIKVSCIDENIMA